MRTRGFFILALLTCVLLLPSAWGDSKTQTSWVGGPGVSGPVINWGTTFSSSAYIDYSGTPGMLRLGQVLLETPEQHTVRTGMSAAMWTYGADVDLDGDMDLIGAIHGWNDVYWWENFEDIGDTWIDHLVDGSFGGACCVMAADIDDDGDTDLVGAASTADDVAWWRNEGTGLWTKITVDSNFDGAWTVFPIDIDRDGDLDIVGSARNADDVAWWSNIGGMGTSWVKNTIDGSFDGASHICCTDVNGDGYMDVIGAAEFAGLISWWQNYDGSGGTWIERNVTSGFNGASSVQAIDMDQDGDMDILACANSSDELAWFRNSSSGYSWTQVTIEAGLNGVCSAWADDLDGDGDMDVATCVYGDDDILWFRNLNGSGTSWEKRIVHQSFDGAYTVHCADMDNNGTSDIICTGEQENANAWWQLTGYCPSGELVSSILDTGSPPDWGTFNFGSISLPGAGVRFQVRSSDTPSNMGPWSTYFSNSGFDLDQVLEDGTRYFQYKAALMSNDPVATPILNSVTVLWSVVGVGGDEFSAELAPGTGLIGVSPNPSVGNAVVAFQVERQTAVTICLFDLSGRIVTTVVDQTFGSGQYTAAVSDLLPGLYLCRMTTAEGEGFTARLAVIE